MKIKIIFLILFSIIIPLTGYTADYDGWWGNGSVVWQDDFSTNTVANYTALTAGTLNIANGVATQASTSTSLMVQYNNSLGSSNQSVQAVITDQGSGSAASSGLVIRSNGSSFHYCSTFSNNIRCLAFNGGTTSSFPTFTGGTWADGERHLIKITTNSSNIYRLYVDWNNDGDFDDSGETEGTFTNSSYSGTYAGFGFYVANGTGYVDDFKAGINQ